MNNEQTQQADDPGGPGWRDVMTGGVTQDGDMVRADDNFPLGRWVCAEPGETVTDDDVVRRRIEPQQPSDSEPETMDDLRRRLAECEVLLAEYDRGGQQVNAELQQLREQVQTLTLERDEHARKLEFARESGEMSRRQLECEAGKVERLEEQVQTLTRERDRYRNQLAGAIEHSKAPEAQAQLVDRLQKWLRPVLEVVSDHPDHSSILAVSVLEFLPQIASRLIEE